MTRRPGAAKALVEQPGVVPAAGTGFAGPLGSVRSSRMTSRRVHGSPHRPVLSAHLTSTTGRAEQQRGELQSRLLSVTQCYGVRAIPRWPAARIAEIWMPLGSGPVGDIKHRSVGSARGVGKVLQEDRLA
jgi:hypothetical protein